MNPVIADQQSNSRAAVASRYLTFTLGRETYGIRVLKVREIIRLPHITTVPQMPDYVKGVINLRGKVIPIVDLRIRFQMANSETAERTCIVVVEVNLASGGKTLTGLVVDGVEEVAQIPSSDIEQAPDFGTKVDTRYILGMAKTKEGVRMLLDIDKVLNAETLEEILQTAAV